MRSSRIRHTAIACTLGLALIVSISPAEGARRKKPNLVVSALSEPPLTLRVTDSFSVSDTTRNAGKKTAKASRTIHYLSADQIKDAGDTPLYTDPTAGRAVPKLKRRRTSSITDSFAVSVLTSIPSGSYFLLGCADATSLVREKSETDNCRASSGAVTVDASLHVTAAAALAPTLVQVFFSHAVDPAFLLANGSQFTIPGLTVSSAVPSNPLTVLLTTSTQTNGFPYVVTAAGSILDEAGNAVAPANNSAIFPGL